MKIFTKNTIAKKLIVYIFLFNAVVMAILTTIQLNFDYSANIKSFEDRITDIKESQLKAITLSVWNIDKKGLETLLDGILHLPDIEEVEVLEKDPSLLKNSSSVISRGSIHSKKTIRNTIPLTYNKDGQNIELGELVIVSSLDNIYNKLIGKGLQIVLINTIITVLVSIFIFVIFQFLVTRHLAKIADYAENIEEENISEPLDILRKNFRGKQIKTNDELDKLVNSINTMNQKLIKHSDSSRLAAIGQTASQVSHDIRSPLAALNSVVKYLPELEEEKRLLLRSAIQRIDDIANDLADKSLKAKQILQTQKEEISVCLLSSLMEPIISEKRVQLRPQLNINILSQIDEKSYGLFAKINSSEFKRVLSNLINNAVESLNSSGIVTANLLLESQDKIKIQIQDNGKGIPNEIIPKLMQKGASFGKEHEKNSGSGLGLYHAKTNIESWGGDVKIDSEIGKGTTVTIFLPKEEPPDWFVPQIKIKKGQTVVILDDDDSIHQIWNNRLSGLSVNLVHYSSPNKIKKYENALYLSDYEFLNHDKTGLDVIETLCIQKNSVLVTSYYEESQVRKKCAELGVKLIPKPLAGFVPIEEIFS
jgi:signal transduction histidine kinase